MEEEKLIFHSSPLEHNPHPHPHLNLDISHNQLHNHHHHHHHQQQYYQVEEQDDPSEELFPQSSSSSSSAFSSWLNLTSRVLMNSSTSHSDTSSSLAAAATSWFNDSFLNNVGGSGGIGTTEDTYLDLIGSGGYNNDTSSPTTLGDINDDEVYSDSILHSLPWWRQLLWCTLFSLMVIVASVGNVTVIWIVLAHKRMRTVTNYLLVNLSIADTMVSTLNVIPNFIFMLTNHWPFGEFYCKLVQFVAVLSICASVFSLMAIAFDRYTAIMNPLRPRMGRRLTLGIAGTVWVLGFILGAPHFVFFTTYERELNSGDSIVLCYGEWPDGPQTESYQEYLYNVFFMIFTYFVPIGVMGYTYTRVGIELWGSKSIGECTQRQLDNIKSKRRVVKMMIVVVIIFAVCWLPYHIYFIWVSHWPEITQHFFIREVYLGLYCLAMSNSMYNPMIYCWMNARFRRGFQQVFQWCPFVHYSEIEVTGVGHVLHHVDTRRYRPGMETSRYSMTGSPENEVQTRVTRNGTSTVHIPLHVLTSTEGSINKKAGVGNHFLSPNGYGNGNKSSRSKNNCKNSNNEFM